VAILLSSGSDDCMGFEVITVRLGVVTSIWI